MINSKRIRNLNNLTYISGPIVYWMSRDQRVRDNWALLYCQEKALDYKVPIVIVFCIVPDFLGAIKRQYLFMIEGLKKVEYDLDKLNIDFQLLNGKPEEKVPWFLKRIKAGLLVTDFDPLKIKRKWKENVSRKIKIPILEVDTHNIVPCWLTSNKQEYAAYTIRPKINKLLFEFLEPFPEMKIHPFSGGSNKDYKTGWKKVGHDIKCKKINLQNKFFKSGENESLKTLKRFIDERLDNYSHKRNNPIINGVSDLSPYLHFGYISAQKIALEISIANVDDTSKKAFLEELIVRRELSDNYCYYNKNYDSSYGFPDWAKKTLKEHELDRREHIYSLEQFEKAETHDPLWNACQMEMVIKGKMHGYMRMYWAKKILEWSTSIEDSMEIAIMLNDRYELDGRDPNGYTGIAWSIGGVHDRAWFERPVFGKVRYMNERGCRSKFNVDQYIKKINFL